MLNFYNNIPNVSISKIYEKKHLEYIRTKPNILAVLIKKYPNEIWDMEALSENPNVTWDIVEHTIDKNWNWNKLSRYNPHISIEVIKKFIDFWNWKELTLNSYISYHIIEAFADKDWNWDDLSHNKCIKFSYPKDICRNSELNMKIFEKYPERINWDLLSENLCLTFDIVEKYPTKPWNWEKLSLHKNLTDKIIIKNITFPWVWHAICLNTKINIFKIQERFPLINISNYTQNKNPNITLEIAEINILKKFEERDKFSYHIPTCLFYMGTLFQDLSYNYFIYDDNVLEKNMREDNLINTILVFETIDKQKLNNRAENIRCRSSICDYNMIKMIADLL